MSQATHTADVLRGNPRSKARQLKGRRSHRSQNHFISEVREALSFTGYHLKKAISPDYGDLHGSDGPDRPHLELVLGDIPSEALEASAAEFEKRRSNSSAAMAAQVREDLAGLGVAS